MRALGVAISLAIALVAFPSAADVGRGSTERASVEASRAKTKKSEMGSGARSKDHERRTKRNRATAASAAPQGRPKGKKAARSKRTVASRTVERASASPPPVLLQPTGLAIRCPRDMVAVAGRVCVDRWESSLENAATGAVLSPFYPPSRELAQALFLEWSRAREEAPPGSLAREMEVPPPFGLFGPTPLVPVATSRPHVLPNGYLSGTMARAVCAAAGKRLCTEAEWVTACRGEQRTAFPYGDRYEDGACNVFREEHPAHVLHGTFSHNHKDPRLNGVDVAGRPLLRKTGETVRCASRWGDDAIWDMVGNLDEWIDDPEGTFLGGFYSRATRAGCSAKIAGHPIGYFDYSTGVRCCKDP